MSTLSASNLVFAYRKDQPVINNVSLSVSSDERVALQAPSGFGKSTLCQLLAGYLKPDAGTIEIDGKPLAAKPGTPNPIQMIWQHPEQAVDPYLRMGKTLEDAGTVPPELLKGLGIKDEWLTRFPHELSGGELQRFCIARALAVKPRFLIADEVSTMLDAVTQAQIWAYLMQYCEDNQVGMLLVSHSPALTAQVATRIINLKA